MSHNPTWGDISTTDNNGHPCAFIVAWYSEEPSQGGVCTLGGSSFYQGNGYRYYFIASQEFLSGGALYESGGTTLDVGDWVRIQPIGGCIKILEKVYNNNVISSSELFQGGAGHTQPLPYDCYFDTAIIAITGHGPFVIGDQPQYNQLKVDYFAGTNTSTSGYASCDSCLGIAPNPNGCTDPLASNYNANATVDDGSCTYLPISGCTDSTAQNYNSSATVDDGSCIYCAWGCTDPTAFNYNPSANCDNGSCIPCVNGCTNPSSSNYNPLATCDDGSCIGCIYGCIDSTSSNYDVSATCDDGSCCVDGCTDSTALNYNVLATCDDGSCEHCIDGCTDHNASNYNIYANCDDGSCLESECGDCFKLLDVLYEEANCEGCNEDDYLQEKRNLQRFANLRIMRNMAYECGDTDYVETMQAEEYEMCSTLLDEHTNEGVNDYKIYGCTNPTSANYNPKATHPCTRKGVVNFCCGNSSTLKTSGCTDPTSLNYNPAATVDDGSCTYCVWGCTDSTAYNYDLTATCDNGGCIPCVNGCMDATAYNYTGYENNAASGSAVTCDDGSCIISVGPI